MPAVCHGIVNSDCAPHVANQRLFSYRSGIRQMPADALSLADPHRSFSSQTCYKFRLTNMLVIGDKKKPKICPSASSRPFFNLSTVCWHLDRQLIRWLTPTLIITPSGKSLGGVSSKLFGSLDRQFCKFYFLAATTKYHACQRSLGASSRQRHFRH